jgi:putative oxidoreductase
MDIALLALRVVVGLLMAGHGAQKLFGAFGGHGIEGTAGFFESIGVRPARRNAVAAGAAELGAGVLLVLGLMTPLAAALVISVMVVAIATVHAKNGPWVTEGGYEYNVVLMAVAFALAGVGPGGISLDNALGWMPDITGTGAAFGALAVGMLGGLATTIASRTPPRPAAVRDDLGMAGAEARFTRGDPATRAEAAADAEAEAEAGARPHRPSGSPGDPRR